MAVETYEVEEIANNVDDCAETRELIASLGLDGQNALVVNNTGIFPYRKMTTEECNVYERILPIKTPAKNYSSGSIPLRVLQVMSHADSLKFFSEFEIWHPEDVRTDPLLVGLKQVGQYSWNKERYILARWGEVLESFDVLREKALKSAKVAMRSRAMEAKVKAEYALATLDTWPSEKLFADGLPA